MKIKVIMHVNDLPGAFELLSDQMTRASESGLLDAADEWILCTNGAESNFDGAKEALAEFDNVHFVHTSNDTKLWEWPTLDFMKKICDETDEDFAICYYHLKGLSRLNDQRVTDWRLYMEHFMVENWEQCFAKVSNDFDLVGTNIIEQPWLHSSGNFWWTRASYVRTLDALVHPADTAWGTISPYTGARLDEGNFRYDHEAWIGSKSPKYFEISHTPGKAEPGWHFNNTYPREIYDTSKTQD